MLIEDYVRAGFRKIHLDCSMSCADDPSPLSDATVAQRAARLCAVAERAHARTGGEPPVYVIGTEVPVPGGAAEELDTVAVTTPDAARATIDDAPGRFSPRPAQPTRGTRVIALVVQPGVEFDHRKVVDYAAGEGAGAQPDDRGISEAWCSRRTRPTTRRRPRSPRWCGTTSPF